MIYFHFFSGDMFFHGPWFVRPADVEHAPNRLFYKHEVFKSSIEDTNPVNSIQVGVHSEG